MLFFKVKFKYHMPQFRVAHTKLLNFDKIIQILIKLSKSWMVPWDKYTAHAMINFSLNLCKHLFDYFYISVL